MIKKIVLFLYCALMGVTVNAQFSLDIGVNFLHLYNEERPILPNKMQDFAFEELSASYSARYQHNDFFLSIGFLRYRHSNEYPAKEDVINGDPFLTIQESFYSGINYTFINTKSINVSGGFNCFFKHKLLLYKFIYFPEIHDRIHNYFEIDDDPFKIGFNLELEFAPSEFAVFRLKSMLIMPSRKDTPLIEHHPSYMLYQLSYGFYL